MLIAALGPPGLASALTPIEVVHEVRLEPGQLTFEPLGDGRSLPALAGHAAQGAPGEPRLPVRVLRLALPPGAELAGLRLEVEELAPPIWLPLPAGGLALAESPRLLCPAPGCARRPPTGPAPPPTARAWLQGSGRLGTVGVAELAHRPLVLDPAGDGLWLHPHQRLRLRTTASADAATAGRPRARLLARAAGLVDNAAELRRLHPLPRDRTPGAGGVAVVTPTWLAEASQMLPAYLASLQARGFQPHLVTTGDLQAWTGEPPDQLAQKLRAWLVEHHDPLELEALVLLGDPDPVSGDLPMLATHPYQPGEVDFLEDVPTDAYYADLTGRWDLDGDGRFGEFEGDRGPGGVDFHAELEVGRLPVYGDLEQAELLLRRAMDYPRPLPDAGWRRRLLLPASMLFFDDPQGGSRRMDGADLARAIRPEFNLAGFAVSELFEADGVDPSRHRSPRPLTENEVIEAWRPGAGLVYWLGHGSEESAHRTVWVADTNADGWSQPWEQASPAFAQARRHQELPAERPAFVFHGSCSNGTPEHPGNLAAVQLRTGAIAAFASTRVALGQVLSNWRPDPSSCETFMTGYYVAAGLRDGLSAGQSLADARLRLSDAFWGPACWHTRLGIALYGDPTLTLYHCQADADCEDGLTCGGQKRCDRGLCVQTGAVDCSHLDVPCARGRCQEPEGQCVLEPLEGEPCDDGLQCTRDDRCRAGVCRGTELACGPSVVACQEHRCLEELGACRLVPATDGESCLLPALSDPQPGRCLEGRCEPAPTRGAGCGTQGTALGSLFFSCWALLIYLRSRLKNRD